MSQVKATPDGGVGFVWTMGVPSNYPWYSYAPAYNYLRPNGTLLVTDLYDVSALFIPGWGTGTTWASFTSTYWFPNLTGTSTAEVVCVGSVNKSLGNNGRIRMGTYRRGSFGQANTGTGLWKGLQPQTLPSLPDTLAYEAVYPHTASSENTIHVVTSLSDSVSYSGFSALGVYNGLAYMRSTDNGATFQAQLFDTISSSHNYTGVKVNGMDIDAQGQNVAIVVTAITCRNEGPGTEVLLFKSTDNGTTWKARTIERIDPTDTNHIQYMDRNVPYNGSVAATNDGAYSVLLDNRGMAHVAVGHGFIPVSCDGSNGSAFYFNGMLSNTEGHIKYWNESFPKGASPSEMQNIAAPVDFNRNGHLDIRPGNSTFNIDSAGNFTHSPTGYPTLSVDAENNIYLLYHAPTEGSADAGGHPLQDLFLTASRDQGKTWSSEMNYAGKFGGYADASGGTANLEETSPCALKHIGADKKLHLTYIADETAGLYFYCYLRPSPNINYLPNAVVYTSAGTEQILGSFIGASFPSHVCAGTTYTCTYNTPSLPAGTPLKIQLDTSTAHAFNPADSLRWLTLGSATLSGTSGTLSYTLPHFGRVIKGRIRLAARNTLTSKETEIYISNGAPVRLEALTLYTPVNCVNNNGANTFNTPAHPDLAEYIWKVNPAEAAKAVGAAGNNATIYWNSAYTGPAIVSVTGKNDCGQTAPETFTVHLSSDAILVAEPDLNNTGTVTILNGSGLYNWYVNGVRDPNDSSYQYSIYTPFGECLSEHGGTLWAEDRNRMGCFYMLTVPGSGLKLDAAISTSGPATLCGGGQVQLRASSGYSPASYLWNTGDTTRVINVTVSGNYSVRVIGGGCTSAVSQTVPVRVVPVPAAPVISLSGGILQAYGGISYTWFYNGNPVAGQNGPVLPVNGNGNYTVSLTDTNGCTSPISQPYLITDVATSFSEPDLHLVPNPAGRFCRVEGLQGLQNVVIYSALGQAVYQGQAGPDTILDLEMLPDALYEVRIAGKGLRLVKTD